MLEKKVKIRVALLSLILILLCLLYRASSSLFSQIYLVSAHSDANSQRDKDNSGNNRYEKNYALLSKSLSWESRNSLAWEAMGNNYWSRFAAGEDIETNGKNTLDSYRRAIYEEPSKAQYWIKLALIKAGLHEFDGEFYQAYQTAFDYGGWEYHIDQALMELGLAYWYSMQIEYRMILKEAAIRSYEVEPVSTLNLAEEYGQFHMVCIWVRNSQNISHRCERELADKKPVKRKRK